VGGGLHLGRRHSGGRSSDALAATQLLEEDDDLLYLIEAVRGRLGSRRATKMGRFGGLRSGKSFPLFSVLILFPFSVFRFEFYLNLNSVLQVLSL
jgi:hypothetical protein